jgi:hypothetical protein
MPVDLFDLLVRAGEKEAVIESTLLVENKPVERSLFLRPLWYHQVPSASGQYCGLPNHGGTGLLYVIKPHQLSLYNQDAGTPIPHHPPVLPNPVVGRVQLANGEWGIQWELATIVQANVP